MVNIPLALWVISGSTGDDPADMAGFSRALIVGLIPVFLWLLTPFPGLPGRLVAVGYFLGGLSGLGALLGLGIMAGWVSFR